MDDRVVQQQVSRPEMGEITVRDLIADLRRARFRVLGIILFLAGAGLALGVTSDRQYEASMMLAPVTEEAGSAKLGGLSALASQYSGLASLAGITIPGGSKKEESIAVLQSELLTEKYVRDNDLLPILYSNLWDPVAHKWKVSDPKKIPTVWQANRMFRSRIRQVNDDKKTGLIVMSIRWKDPKLAAKWANDLVALTNNYLREKAIREADRNITYLNEQVAKTGVLEVQKAIYSLLEQEINKEMLARGRDEYALKVIDPAVVPEKPSPPGPIMMTLFGFAAGCLLSVLWVFGRRVLMA